MDHGLFHFTSALLIALIRQTRSILYGLDTILVVFIFSFPINTLGNGLDNILYVIWLHVVLCMPNLLNVSCLFAGDKKAVVANSRACTLCKECVRGVSEKEQLVKLERAKDHFICESFAHYLLFVLALQSMI